MQPVLRFSAPTRTLSGFNSTDVHTTNHPNATSQPCHPGSNCRRCTSGRRSRWACHSLRLRQHCRSCSRSSSSRAAMPTFSPRSRTTRAPIARGSDGVGVLGRGRGRPRDAVIRVRNSMGRCLRGLMVGRRRRLSYMGNGDLTMCMFDLLWPFFFSLGRGEREREIIARY